MSVLEYDSCYTVCMKSNTIRLESALLEEIYPIIGKNQSLASFVRSVLQKEIDRHKQKKSAKRYVQFLSSSASEMELLSEWESSPLETPIKIVPKKVRRSK